VNLYLQVKYSQRVFLRASLSLIGGELANRLVIFLTSLEFAGMKNSICVFIHYSAANLKKSAIV
jgi:hypothetical protein